jgi:hypothetical protein
MKTPLAKVNVEHGFAEHRRTLDSLLIPLHRRRQITLSHLRQLQKERIQYKTKENDWREEISVLNP